MHPLPQSKILPDTVTLRSWIVLAGILCLLVSGCGGGGKDAASDEAKAKATVRGFYRDVRPKVVNARPWVVKPKAEEACSLLSEGEKRRYTGDLMECPTAIERFWDVPDGHDAIARIYPAMLEIDPQFTMCGDRAWVDYPGERVVLVKIDGTWYINNFTLPTKTCPA